MSPALIKNPDPIGKIAKAKRDWRHGSSDKVPI
jgi:hypothetical protein